MSSIQQFAASVSWLHEIGRYESPMNNNIVCSVLDSTKRQLATSTVHKVPFTTDMLHDLHDSMFKKPEDRTLINV